MHSLLWEPDTGDTGVPRQVQGQTMTLFVFCSEILFLETLQICAWTEIFYINKDTNLQFSFPPSTWVLFPDQNQLTRSQGELFRTSSSVGSNNLGNF